MASETKTIGNLKMPVGTYPSTRDGQKTISKRHREVGTVMETTYDGGRKQILVKLHLEILSIELQALLRANKLIKEGDDSILCPVYAREARADAPAADQGKPAEDDGYPEDRPF